jgi:hypothetical protein
MIDPLILVRLSGRYGGRGKCRSCGANIVWYETLGGKKMPFNGSPRPLHLRRDESDPQRRWIGELPRVDVHWATCPQATSWRNRQAKRGAP